MFTVHGGNLDAVERQYGIPKERIIDFSGNVNPLGPPEPVLRAIAENTGAISRYPDIEYRSLRRGIAAYTGVDAEFIIPGNGSTELISAFIRTQAVDGRPAVVVSPAYSEYERELALARVECRQFALRPEDGFLPDIDGLVRLARDAGLIVICNPNNPTGTAILTAEMERILASCPDARVMVDETYAEFTTAPILSGALTARYPNLYVVRGTSKFFAVPGLRLGYAICGDADTRKAILARKDPWSVNILSSIAGEAMFTAPGMDEYISATKALTEGFRKQFQAAEFTRLRLYDSHANFILARIDDTARTVTAKELTERLLVESNLLLRDAASFPYLGDGYFRFCMRLPEENARLITALRELL